MLAENVDRAPINPCETPSARLQHRGRARTRGRDACEPASKRVPHTASRDVKRKVAPREGCADEYPAERVRAHGFEQQRMPQLQAFEHARHDAHPQRDLRHRHARAHPQDDQDPEHLVST